MLNKFKVDVEYIKHEDINDIIDYCRKNLTRKNFNLTKPRNYFYKSYQIARTDDSVEIIYYTEDHKFRRVKWSKFKAYPEKSENAGFTGQTAYEFINDKYKELKTKNKSSSLFSDLSGNKYKDEYTAIKKCIPAAINYANYSFKDRILYGISKADISSAYPTEASKSLPTLHDCKKEIGFVRPTAEYPFAFYINSHHLAIYNELDTRRFNRSKIRNYYPQYRLHAEETSWKPIDNLRNSDEVTILCKAADISLKPIFDFLYENRKDNPEFKYIMNAFIGRCQYNANPILSHISAVVLARSVNSMLSKIEILLSEGNRPIFISTDSIAWIGGESKCATFEKFLGSFTYESLRNKFFLRGLKAYQYINLRNEVSGVCGHISKDDLRRYEFGAIPPVSANEYFIIETDGTITEIM